MEQLKCKNCGAPLEEDGHCAYCGSRYRIDRTLVRPFFVEVEHPQVRRYLAEIAVDRRVAMKGDSDIGEAVKNRLAGDMARGIAEAMKITVRRDPINDVVIVRGELRVVDPSFRF